jgi:hypothetical protein
MKYTLQKMAAGNSEFTADFFNESSKAWLTNKVKVGEQYRYKCEGTCLTGKACKHNASYIKGQDIPSIHTCKQHSKQATFYTAYSIVTRSKKTNPAV